MGFEKSTFQFRTQCHHEIFWCFFESLEPLGYFFLALCCAWYVRGYFQKLERVEVPSGRVDYFRKTTETCEITSSSIMDVLYATCFLLLAFFKCSNQEVTAQSYDIHFDEPCFFLTFSLFTFNHNICIAIQLPKVGLCCNVKLWEENRGRTVQEV
ncbi:hypothetical protein QQP08_026314 [Theobroma cacao]|nr:hypothetical protein QQP08_026314 [Theobroma cacao]